MTPFDFRNFLKTPAKRLCDEFLESYSTHINLNPDSVDSYEALYKEIFELFGGEFMQDRMLLSFERLARYQISLETPYVIISNEIATLKSFLISNIDLTNAAKLLAELLELFRAINNKVARVYLDAYIQKLISVNNIRLSSLSDLLEKNVIRYYESHLIWVMALARSVQEAKKDDFPELDPTLCDFGKWLLDDAKRIIQNNSKYKTITILHDNLHLFGKKIEYFLGKEEYHILITYLEKCELISLGIGTELALIDNIITNKRVSKDDLTGALNRNALKEVFANQYELALATNNPYVLAICDLDNFKKINDTYGHIAGDRVLKEFVTVVKRVIRNSDIAVRYGGEEFIIILQAAKKQKGLEVLERIREAFEQSVIEYEGKSVSTTVSIGAIEITPQEGFKAIFLDEYINIADQKLYRAKDSGKNRVEMY